MDKKTINRLMGRGEIGPVIKFSATIFYICPYYFGLIYLGPKFLLCPCRTDQNGPRVDEKLGFFKQNQNCVEPSERVC